MTRSVYVAGIGRGDGRQVIELGVMELLTRQVDRVGVFRPLAHEPEGGEDDKDGVFALLRSRYRLTQTAAAATGMAYDRAAALLAERGTDELVTALLDRYHEVARAFEVVLVLGTDYADTQLPAELALNARLANEFGAGVLAVVAGHGQGAESVVAEVRNARHAFTSLGCDVIAVIANRVREGDTLRAVRELGAQLPEPVYALPEDPALAAPTVAQVAEELGAEVLLGDASGLARDIRDFVFGGAMLPTFLTALREGCMVITPGDREDLVVGALAAHSAGAPPLAGLLLTLGERPGPQTMALAQRLAPGTPLLAVPEGSYPTATAVSGLEGRLTAAAPRKAELALGLFETHVDTAALTERLSVVRSDRVTPMMFEHELIERARADRRRIVLPEGTEERVLRAAEILLRRNVCDLTLLGEPDAIRKRVADLGLGLRLLGPEEPEEPREGAAEPGAAGFGRRAEPGGPAAARVVDPATSPLRERFAEVYARLRAHRGVTPELAFDVVGDVSYFGTLMVEEGLADGMVSGAAHSTAATIRPAFEVIRTRPGAAIVSSVFFMCLADKVLVYGDCAVNPDPDAGQLADIAIQSAATAARFGVEPRVAMLSYSTGTSGSGADVDKVREATGLVRELRPDLRVEGPIQYDAAVEPSVAATKLPGSAVAGQATVLIFPDLNTGNNTYKAVQRSAGAVAVGPVLQGLRKPVNDLSRGALVQDIVNTVAITAVQAQDVAPADDPGGPAGGAGAGAAGREAGR
ncbi:phosphate acetyltransferase [Streptomyces hoynatensis]|uniref:Phosphate acetyltransferase n=1 Tax=Streptomyces hoynatensis TaxID=1141874 RepID=A0A3A9YXX7_9ACTN|nr:phosphate acetyltransferase [Streptomyces hoynatensis]RKN40873.1 phosphate acetyltransferase [Streptomyces hoynatensis]